MHLVISTLSRADPSFGEAVRVIPRFDDLIEGRAGIAPIIRAVAVLTGSAARIVEPRYGIALRADVTGHVQPVEEPANPRWITAPLAPNGAPGFWLERVGTCTLLEAMVLDRAAFATRAALDRTRRADHASRSLDYQAAMETLLDRKARESSRRKAADVLRFPPGTRVRAVAVAGVAGHIELATSDPIRWQTTRKRTGIGPAAEVLDLPQSWDQARIALRFAADDTDNDPGPTVMLADELGGLSLLADAVDPAATPPDVLALESAASARPDNLRTLVEFTRHNSLRLAAAALFVHHSTLQSRLGTIEQSLGWSVRDSQGRLRVQIALMVRRLLLHPPE